MASSRIWPAELDTCGPGADEGERQPVAALGRVGRGLGQFERAEDAPPDREGIGDRLHARRPRCELVMPEI